MVLDHCEQTSVLDVDHGRANTADGLTEEDHARGYHYYGAYKVYHVCECCKQKRKNFGYDYGWTNTKLCFDCNIKQAEKEENQDGMYMAMLRLQRELFK